MNNALNPDFFVTTSQNLAARSLTFHEDIGSLIESVEGVEQVQLLREARLTYHGTPVMALAIETAKAAETVRRVPVAGSLDEMNRLTAEGKGLIVSESFATNLNAGMGSMVELPTPSGLLKLPVVGIIRDYSDLQGSRGYRSVRVPKVVEGRFSQYRAGVRQKRKCGSGSAATCS